MRRILLLALLAVFAMSATAAEITMMNWNLLNFPGSTGSARVPYMQTVVAAAEPDFMTCQEIAGVTGRNMFLNSVLNAVDPDEWSVALFHDGYDTDRALFFRTAKLEVTDAGWLDTDLRSIDWWQLRDLDSQTEFRIFTMHLKASTGSDNEAQRLAEVTILRNYLDTLPPDLPCAVSGDYNIYTSSEAAYQKMLSAGVGQLFDPINRPGNWHDNAAFADIHTQSTRTASFGGGATGGMDDRFDQILVTNDFLDGQGAEILAGTYEAYGNDGQHFNQAIIDGVNYAVPPEVAEGIYQSSDHCPVRVHFSFPAGATDVASLTPSAPALRAWPNPFNPTVSLRIEAPGARTVDLRIYDIGGRAVAELLRGVPDADGRTVTWQPVDLPSGMYFARLSANGRPLAAAKLVLLK